MLCLCTDKINRLFFKHESQDGPVQLQREVVGYFEVRLSWLVWLRQIQYLYCRLQSIMGNIELQQTYTKRKPIFVDKVQSRPETVHPSLKQAHPLLKEAHFKQEIMDPQVKKADPQVKKVEPETKEVYPKTEAKYQKGSEFQTIKKQSQQRQSTPKNDQMKTFRGRPKVEKIIRERAVPRDNKIPKESSRVNNINEFLIHLRRQMNQQSVGNSRAEQDDRSKYAHENDRSRYANEGNRYEDGNEGDSRQLVLNLRLQNERLQLQKYKGLVQRELEKSYSIESIKLQGHNKQKKLIIKYEELKHARSHLQNSYESDKKLTLEDRISKENSKYRDKVERAKSLYQQLAQKTYFLEEMLERYQQQPKATHYHQQPKATHYHQQQKAKQPNQTYYYGQPSAREERNLDSDEQIRVQKIEKLFKNIDALQSSQTLAEAKIKQALQMKRETSESDLSSFQSES